MQKVLPVPASLCQQLCQFLFVLAAGEGGNLPLQRGQAQPHQVMAGRTLRAEPGHGVYDIIPAAGHVVPEFPSPWFAALEWEPVPEPEPAQEPQAESEQGPEPEHGTDEGQSF